jgi:hypothetical protein
MTNLNPRNLAAVATSLLALGALAPAADAANILDIGGQAIPNTGNPQAQLVGGPTVVTKLGTPATPSDDNPAALAALGSPGDPESDLAAALDSMGAAAAANDRAKAASARNLAVDILEGNPIGGKAYSGMPLLNWNSPAKVKNVPAGGNVVVREVRWDEHALSDTWLLSFDDPNQPYTITFRIAELGTTFGSALTPAPLLSQNGNVIGGETQVLAPLAPPMLAMGTSTTNRFTPGGGPEFTRTAVQDVTVAMPPPGVTDEVLEPDLKPGSETLFTLQRTNADHLNAARADFGFSSTSPSAAEKTAAINRLADVSPEKELWSDLRDLRPDAPGFLNAAGLVASGDRSLVGAMKTRSSPAAGVAHDLAADVNVDFVNNETYLFRGNGPLPTPGNGNNLRVATTNADGFTHHLVGMALTNSAGAPGRIGWGQFSWQPVSSTSIAAGGSGTVNVPLPSGTFAVWLGDPDSGDQAGGLCGIPADGNTNQASLSCPIAFKPVGPAPAGGHVRVPDQGQFIGGSTLGGNTVRVGTRPGCKSFDWLTRSGVHARVGMLNQKRSTVLKCLGRPTGAAKRRSDERWRYGKHLILHIVNGRVRSFDLRTNHYVAKSNLGVGSPLSRVRKALGRTLLDRRAKVYRAVTPGFSKKRYANVRVHYSRKGKHKVTRIEAKLVTRKSLDLIGRRLAARTR